MADRQKLTKFLPLVLLALFLLVWGYLLSHISPQEIVNRFGVHNGYLAVFVIAAIGGLSTFITIPYQLVVITLAAGGLDPFFLGILAGSGLMLGDTTSYLIGYHGRIFLPAKLEQVFTKIYSWLRNKPEPVIYVSIFFYGAAFPIPNDFIVIPLGIMRFPYINMMVPLLLGNIVSNTVLAYFGMYAINWFATH